jgi:hypothetical protein
MHPCLYLLGDGKPCILIYSYFTLLVLVVRFPTHLFIEYDGEISWYAVSQQTMMTE